MDNYFTPDISDIRVGYECERVKKFKSTQIESGERVDEVEWEKFVWPSVGILPDMVKSLRTPYLTKEQIEKEGWKNTTHELNCGIWTFEKKHMKLWYSYIDKILQIMNLDFSRETTRPMGYNDDSNFKGQCKDINTFRYICKLLNI